MVKCVRVFYSLQLDFCGDLQYCSSLTPRLIGDAM